MSYIPKFTEELYLFLDLYNLVQKESSSEKKSSLRKKETTSKDTSSKKKDQSSLYEYDPRKNGLKTPSLSFPVYNAYEPKFIEKQRKIIYDTLVKKYRVDPNFTSPPNILQSLFKLYDEYFFNNQISEIMEEKNITLKFAYNSRLTSVAGRCDRDGCKYDIYLSTPIILGTFNKDEKIHHTGGLQCKNRLECLMIVFEHELIHFVIGIVHGHWKKDKIYKSHGLFFQDLSNAYFGHTEYYHRLKDHGEASKNNGKREDFNVGDYVQYYASKTNQSVVGVIYKLNPVRADIGTAKVPYSMLRHATKEEKEAYKKQRENKIDYSKVPIIHSNKNPKYFSVGDIVSVDTETGVYTEKISGSSAEKYDVGKYRIPKESVRSPTQEELDLYKTKVPVPTRDDFRVGQKVKFRLKGATEHVGYISVMNPKTAKIDGYSVHYSLLTKV